MDMWKPFRKSTLKPTMLRRPPSCTTSSTSCGTWARLSDAVRKAEYKRLEGKMRKFIKGQKYTLLSHRENLTCTGRASLKMLLKANKATQYGLPAQESFGQLWDYRTELWARRFFDNWRDALKWQRLDLREVRRDDRQALGWIVSFLPTGTSVSHWASSRA